MIITARNVNTAFVDAWWYLKVSGVEETSRNGRVLVAPAPVMTRYLNPTERILWSPVRDANPFFHLLESLWMLGGRDDAAYVQQFNSRMATYAEPDGRIHGAYGMRWRHAWGIDQLTKLITLLKQDPETRRAVLAMWYPTVDLDTQYLDLPCNTHAYFSVKNGALDMTVCNRSNDILWGLYGANAVHFSMLHEFMANACDFSVGFYTHFSNNFHAYLDLPMVQHFLERPPNDAYDMYAQGEEPYPYICEPGGAFRFFADLNHFFMRNYAAMSSAFLIKVAAPMQNYYLRRNKAGAAEQLYDMPVCDWRTAALRWVDRRKTVPQDAPAGLLATH